MTGPKIQMVDLHRQYVEIKEEIDAAIHRVIDEGAFIRGEGVSRFEQELAEFLEGAHCIGVGNGTDALQIAAMVAGLGPGDEFITTPFTFVATAEAPALLGATPVFVDIDPDTFNIDPDSVAAAITPRTRAILPVHLFGQAADIDPILDIARDHDLFVIEDNAQAIGSKYKGRSAGYLGDLGCLSFFPSKNLGAYGDGGAILTSNEDHARRARMISNHGSERKYYNEIIGVNSRLDTLQAEVLRVKLRHLSLYTQQRQAAAQRYDILLYDVEQVQTPSRAEYATHVFHQYTIRVHGGAATRDGLQRHLGSLGIPSAVYYPVPLHKLPAFRTDCRISGSLDNAERAADEVLSLPMHPHLTVEETDYICEAIRNYFRG